MSFSFNAVGTKDEVTAQLGQVDVSVSKDRFNYFGADLRKLLIEHFEQETASATPGYEYRYTVKANGHGGGNVPLSLQLTIEPLYVRSIPADEPDPATED